MKSVDGYWGHGLRFGSEKSCLLTEKRKEQTEENLRFKLYTMETYFRRTSDVQSTILI